MTATPPSRPLRRVEASQYLKSVWGIDRAPTTLAKLAVVGGGPRFQKVGNIPIYPPELLDEWVEELLSPPVGSTSELSEWRQRKAGRAGQRKS